MEHSGAPLCHRGCELIFLDWQGETDKDSLPDFASQIFGDESYDGKFRALDHHVRIGGIEDGVIEEILFNMPTCEDGITTIMIPQYYSVNYLYDVLKEKNLREFLVKKGLFGDILEEKLQSIRNNLAVIAFQPNYKFITKDSAKIAVNIALSRNGREWSGTDGREAPLEEGEFVEKKTFRGKWSRCERAIFPDLVENLEAVAFIRQILRRFDGQPQYCSQHGMEEIGAPLCHRGCDLIFLDWQGETDKDSLPDFASQIFGDESYNGKFRALDHRVRIGEMKNGVIEDILFNMPTCEDGITMIMIPQYYSVNYLFNVLKEKHLRAFLKRKKLYGEELEEKLRCIRRNLAVIAFQPNYRFITTDLAKIAVNIALSTDGRDWIGTGRKEAPLPRGKSVEKEIFIGKWSRCERAVFPDLVENQEAVAYIKQILRRLDDPPQYCCQHGMEKIGINGTGTPQIALDAKRPLRALQCQESDEIARKRRRQMDGGGDGDLPTDV